MMCGVSDAVGDGNVLVVLEVIVMVTFIYGEEVAVVIIVYVVVKHVVIVTE